MALNVYEEIDITQGGDTFYEAVEKSKNNWATLDELQYGIATLADDATPSVDAGRSFVTGGTTTITDFDDGLEGQIIHIISEHAITITDGTNIFLSGSTNWTMAATDTLTLICKADGKWYELSRSDNT